MTKSTDSEGARRTGGPAVLELVAGAVGAVISLGMLGLMASDALTSGPDLPPNLRVEAAALHRRGAAGSSLGIRVVNTSHQTAAGVAVEGQLLTGPAAVETGKCDARPTCPAFPRPRPG